MTTSKYVVAIAAFILFAGCGTATDSTSPTVGNTTPSLSTALVIKADDITEGYKDQGIHIPDALNEAATTLQALISQYKAGYITAGELSEGADKIIEANAENPVLRVAVPQLISHATLNALLEGENAEDASAYIARHTESLVNNNSPHADIVSHAIEVLDDHWANEKTSMVARKAMDNAEDFLGRDQAHIASKAEGHRPSGEISVQQFDDSRANSKAGISSGIQQLEQYLAE